MCSVQPVGRAGGEVGGGGADRGETTSSACVKRENEFNTGELGRLQNVITFKVIIIVLLKFIREASKML